MFQSSLLETLSLLRPDEMSRLHKFVYSPYFNDGPYARDLMVLWDHVRTHAPAFEHPDLSTERTYAVLYPGKAFVKGKTDVLMSKLHQLVKQFAAQLISTDFDPTESLRLAAFFLDRGVPNRAEPILEKLREEQSRQKIHNAKYWIECFVTQLQAHRFDTARQNNHAHTSLVEAAHSLHHGYLVLVLELLNTLFFSSRKSKVDAAFAELIAENVPSALQIADLENEPLLLLLSQGFDFVRHPEKHGHESLENFARDLEIHAEALPIGFLRALHAYARNHCTWLFNHGDLSYAPLLFSLLKSGLERGLLHQNGKISASTFLNMVQTGLAAREFDWVKNALEQCRDQIDGVPNPQEFYNYNLANYHYHLGEYDRALNLLLHSSEDLFNNLMARKLELKIYYETDSLLLDSKMDNFKLFVYRQGKKNLTEHVFQMNNTFIDILRSMTASGMIGNAARAEKLLQKLGENQLVAERMWLREQLERLVKSAKKRRR